MAREGTMSLGFARVLPLVVAALASFALASASARADSSTATSTSAAAAPVLDRAHAAELYSRKCAICHGPEGDGTGAAARFMDPRPRDLTRGVYKLRSTPTGQAPTDGDLFRTITRGIRGTAMPGFSGLSADDRWQLVAYVKSLSSIFEDAEAVAPGEIPPAPSMTRELVAKGEGAYRLMECAKCHGADGRGEGPSARALVDDRQDPIYPFDMTRGWKLKAGSSAEDIYRVLVTGLGGTPMPAYEGSLSDDELWALAFYVRSLFLDEVD